MFEKLINNHSNLENQLPCELKYSLIPLNLKKGQQDSKSHLKGMFECKNEKAFKTDFFKMIIDNKWQ